jgi:hypothetical protein
VIFYNPIIIHEGTLSFGTVVIDIIEEGLSNEVEAVEMVQAFDVCWKSTTVLGTDLDLVMLESGFGCLVYWNCDCAV